VDALISRRQLGLYYSTVQYDNLHGRLTLNALLSFAQFEREVTGERDQRQSRREEEGHVDGRPKSNLSYQLRPERVSNSLAGHSGPLNRDLLCFHHRAR
jgi:DNA invertase Pin-like site-specific DNA recombinase